MDDTRVCYEVSESNYTGRSRPSTAGSRYSRNGVFRRQSLDRYTTPRDKVDSKKKPLSVRDHEINRIRTADSVDSRQSELDQNRSVIEDYFSRHNSTANDASFNASRVQEKSTKAKRTQSSKPHHKHRTHKVSKANNDRDRLEDELKSLVRDTISKGGYSNRMRTRSSNNRSANSSVRYE